MAQIFSADPLSPGESVKRSGLTRPGRTTETFSAAGRVNSTRRSFLQSAGHTAAAAWLPEHLFAVCWDGRTLVHFLLRAGGAADRPHERGTPHDGHASQGHYCQKCQLLIQSRHLSLLMFFLVEFFFCKLWLWLHFPCLSLCSSSIYKDNVASGVVND